MNDMEIIQFLFVVCIFSAFMIFATVTIGYRIGRDKHKMYEIVKLKPNNDVEFTQYQTDVMNKIESMTEEEKVRFLYGEWK